MKLKPGTRLRSQVDATEIIIVRPPAEDVEVACGGYPMIDPQAQPAPRLTAVGDGGGTQLGKRYTVIGVDSCELLVTKPGTGSLTVDGMPVVLKEAKPLPASD
ncbi:MAG TPA: hypothetical protein VHW44_00090 [Pseudonocardiaceae bacterium]|jgi:hypothetical protein|nr:hypothetical protein [Pseudonocardiaceae bacterium]